MRHNLPTLFRRTLSAVLLTGLVTAGAATAQNVDVTLLPATDADLVPRQLVAANLPMRAADVPRESVVFSWPIAADTVLDARPAPFVQESREYLIEVDATREGNVPLYAPAVGEWLVRISPLGADEASQGLDLRNLTLITPDGRALADGAGMAQMFDAGALAAADLPFPRGTAAFRVDASLGGGTYQLAGLPPGRFLVNVVAPESPRVLRLNAVRADHHVGDVLTAEVRLVDGDAGVLAGRVDGYVTSPTGDVLPATFARDEDGVYRARVTIDGSAEASAAGGRAGLWQVHARMDARVAGATVVRHAHVGFAVTAPTAALDGTLALAPTETKGALALRFGVRAAVEGRYEVRGVLYGTDAQGAMRPAAVAHGAVWLNAGAGAVDLVFDPKSLTHAGLGAPYEVRDLRLQDQTRMGLLHRQARGVRIQPSER
ncbi:MAG: DUF4785 domain-containing protein [Acidobacteriota bacterium]